MDAAMIGCAVTGALEHAARGLDLAREIRRELGVAGSEEMTGAGAGGGGDGLERLWRGR